jgi:hypothetical protein
VTEEDGQTVVSSSALILDILKQMEENIALANEAFGPHIAEVAGASAEDLAEANRSTAGPIRRHAERLDVLEEWLREQIMSYKESFDRYVPRREPGTDVLLPMLEGYLTNVGSFRQRNVEQREAAEIVIRTTSEPHVQEAFGHPMAVLTRIIEDANQGRSGQVQC